MMGAHAMLSASGAHRWIPCPPSARLEKEIKDITSIYAQEGTFMHSLAELHLKLYLKKITKASFNKELQVMKKNNFYTEEVEEAVQVYVDIVIERINAAEKDALILLEEWVDFSLWVPEGFGTSDVIIISGSTIEVMDLKGGRGVKIYADDNYQMRLYALGSINNFGILYDLENVKMTIVQPRLDHISTEELKIEDLLDWANTVVKPKAELAYAGKGTMAAGDHCRFCKIKATCRERAKENMKLAALDFKDPPLLTEDEIVDVLLAIDELKKWASDIEDYAYAKAVNEGKRWPGFKLVEGRRSRKYTDEKKIIERLINEGYEEEKIFKKSLLTLTKLEKELGKKKFEEILGDYVERPPGKLQLVPESDKRKEVKNEAQIDFKNKGE